MSRLPSTAASALKPLQRDLNRLFLTAVAGRPVLGPNLAKSLAPLLHVPTRGVMMMGSVAPSTTSFSSNPLSHLGFSPNHFQQAMRLSTAAFNARNTDASLLRRFEQEANRDPGNATAQQVYLNTLYESGFPQEVVSRIEAGRFASSWYALDLYVRCLTDTGRIRNADAPMVRSRLRTMWEQYSGSSGGNSNDIHSSSFSSSSSGVILPPGALQSALSSSSSSPFSSGSSRFGSGGGAFSGFGGGRGSSNNDVYGRSSSSSFSNGGGGGGGGDDYYGYGSTNNNNNNGSAATGTRANPVIVEVAQSRASMFTNVLRMVSMGIVLAVVYQYFTKSMPSPLANLTGDITEEVTDIPTTRFSDVRGADEAKGELQDVVAFLRDPERFKRLGAKVPRGILLTGPPGTGKTLLARAVAGEAGCKFYSKSASEFEEMLVGLGAKRVRELFNSAKKNAPAIIFIDEIDALGGKRKVSIGAGSERQTLNQLLSSMDGFTKNENVIVIGATNSPEILDPALTRPGRFDSTVDVPLPDIKGRKDILELYLSKVIVAPSVDSELLAKATPGFSGAQLEALINSAALMAANRNADQIETQDVEEARDKLIMGPAKKSRARRAETMRLTAYHEGGHTLTSLLTRGADPLHKVTILPRGFSGGATYSLPKDDELATRESILAQIDVCMGGRAAEELIYGAEKVTTGAGMDMSQASDLARRFCAVYSMSELGLSSFGSGSSEPSSERKAAIDTEVEKILRASYTRVLGMMSTHKGELDRLATALLEYETLTADECRQVVEGKQPLPSLKEKLAGMQRERERERERQTSSSSSSSSARSSSSGSGGGKVRKASSDGSEGSGGSGNNEKKPKAGIWASVVREWGLGSRNSSGSGSSRTPPSTPDHDLLVIPKIVEESSGRQTDGGRFE